MTKNRKLIEDYKFGKIKINDKVYTDDVILFGEEVKEGWWREKGHHLSIGDIQEIIDFEPDLLIIGTGSAGRLSIPQSIESKVDFRMESYPTKKACKEYNEKLKNDERIAGAFHLTC
ncbi:MAG: Mth938-like domain-containing protein [Candidatus Saliniplasma sp.]